MKIDKKALHKVLNLRTICGGELNHQIQDSLKLMSIADDQPTPLLEKMSHSHRKYLYNATMSTIPKAKVIVVGKGITYDSGGYNIKTSHMEEMFFDKTGAVLAAALSKELNIPGYCAFLPNLITEESILPGSIVKSLSGKKIYIDNIDAEGRLALADSISAVRLLNPTAHIVTLATLTGHAVRVFGDQDLMPVFSTQSKKLFPILINDYYKKKNKRFWPMESTKTVKTKIENADISNGGGTCQIAFTFLKEFTDNITHVDIASWMVNSGNCPADDIFEDLVYLLKQIIKLNK